MTLREKLFPVNRWLEPALVLVIASGLVYALWHMWEDGYLPQPFFYDPSDIWGDWFNVAYWAYDKGTYDAWGTLYPPMSFVFLRIFTIAHCYPMTAGAMDGSAGLPARSCDWLGLATAHAIYILNIILVAKTYLKIDRRTAPWRAYALVAGFPMLEALEHTNLVMIAFTFVVLGFGPLLKSAKHRWLAIGMAINFKVYLIATVFPQLLQRRWRSFEGAIIATVALYLASYALLGRGTPGEIVKNIQVFASGQSATLLDVWFAATYLPMQSLLENWQSPMMGLIGSRNVDLLLFLIPFLRNVVQASIILASAMAWLRPEVVSRYRLTNLAISLALISTESGGYTPIFIFFFTFMEPWKSFGAKWAIIACFILCIPFDIPIDKVPPVVRDTFFPGRTVLVTYYVMLGPFIRPLILLTVPFALSCVTIRDVWKDIQTQGWKARWRYRRDYPIMVGEGEARPPVTGCPK